MCQPLVSLENEEYEHDKLLFEIQESTFDPIFEPTLIRKEQVMMVSEHEHLLSLNYNIYSLNFTLPPTEKSKF
jgi:hypothetical protein